MEKGEGEEVDFGYYVSPSMIVIRHTDTTVHNNVVEQLARCATGTGGTFNNIWRLNDRQISVIKILMSLI